MTQKNTETGNAHEAAKKTNETIDFLTEKKILKLSAQEISDVLLSSNTYKDLDILDIEADEDIKIINTIIPRVEEVLDSLEEDGKSSFGWAWEQVGKTFEVIYKLKEGGVAKEKILSIFKEHNKSFALWNQLNQDLYDADMDEEVINDDEFREAIGTYRELIRDLKVFCNQYT